MPVTKAVSYAVLQLPDLIREFSLAQSFITGVLDGIPPNLKESPA